MKLTCIEVAFCVSFSRLFTFFSQITAKSHHSGLFMLDFTPHSRQFTQTPVLKTTDAVMLRVGNTLLYKNIDFMPSGKQSCCFLLCGLWHGAAWTFVVWGLFHGTLMMIERVGLQRILTRLPPPVSITYTLVVVLIGERTLLTLIRE